MNARPDTTSSSADRSTQQRPQADASDRPRPDGRRSFGRWWRAAIVIGVLVLVGAAYVVGRMTATTTEHAPAPAADEAAGSDEAAEAERQTEYYCPMHPNQRSTDPDDVCPICGMDLVAAGDDDDDDDADLPRLRVSERSMALMDVATWPAERRAVERDVRLYGRVEADERRVRTISAWVDGRIEHLHVDFTGAVVERGEPMVELYSPGLIAAQEELFQAIAARERLDEAGERARQGAETSVASARERLRLLGLSSEQIEQIEQRGSPSETVTVHAPIGGTVTQRRVSEGEYVDTGTPLFRVEDLSNVWVQFEVFELDLAWLRVGQPVTFTAEAMPGESIEGVVTFIDPVIDNRRRTARVRIEVSNPDGRLKPGMFVTGRVHSSLDEAGRAVGPDVGADDRDLPLVIPATAPLITGERAVVYVRMPDEDRPTFEARQVTLGPKAGPHYVVRDGLEEGDLVVKRGQFKIDSELQIRGRPSMMAPEGVDVLTDASQAPIVPDDLEAFGIDPADVAEPFREQLVRVFDDYIDLVTALADDDYESSEAAVHAMHDAMLELDAAALDAPVQQAWEPVDEALHEALHAMYDADDLDGIRDHLEHLSEYTAVMAEHFAGGVLGPVYRLHCPMAFDDQGADWLQRVENVANPYFGDAMFRCGVVEETVVEDVDHAPGEHRHELEREPEPEPETPETPETEDPRDPHDHGVDVPDAFRESLEPVYAAYFEVKQALADDDLSAFHDALGPYQQAIDDLDTLDLSDASFRAWLRIEDGLTHQLGEATELDDLDSVRERFEHWADAAIELSRTFGHASEHDHLVAHCPMAFDFDGADWLQTTETINNPYFGESMLRCGEIVERIPAGDPAERSSEQGGER